MRGDVDSISFEASGSGAITEAMAYIERFAGDGEFNRVYVELRNSTANDEVNRRQTSLPFQQSNDDTKADARGISRGTSYHKVLSALDGFVDEMPVSTREVLNVLDMPEGTAYAAMSELYDRGLVNRTDEKNENNSFEYEITEAGQRELDRLGKIN